jgi:hypothetical protein
LIVLALATAIRPSSLAAVYALLASASPRRFMFAYVFAGVAFTVTFGVLVIGVFEGIAIDAGTHHTRAVGQVAGGVVALILGVLLLTRRVGASSDTFEGPGVPGRWATVFYHRITTRTAALAGPATHIPGVFYLVALNLIVSQQPRLQNGVLSLLLYNAVWFLLPGVALAICIVNPEAAADVVKNGEKWARRHARTFVTIVSFTIGIVLLVRGLTSL